MPVSSLLLSMLLILARSYLASYLSRIPKDITNHIFSHLDIIAKTKSIPTLSKDHHKYFNQTYFNEFQMVNQLKQWFADNEYIEHLDEIKAIISDLELSELYHTFLPSFLSAIHHHWYINSRSNHDVYVILCALKLRPMSITEFNSNMSKISDQMKILVLASRALINYFIPNSYSNIDLGILMFQPQNHGAAAFNFWSNYPWLKPEPKYNPPSRFQRRWKSGCVFSTDLWPIYMSYLYEFYFFALEDDTNDCDDLIRCNLHASSVFHLDENPKANLLRLIRDYGFIPWTERTLKQIRANLSAYDVMEVYSDFYRIEQRMHVSEYMDDHAFMFRTYLIFKLFKECNYSLPDNTEAMQSFKWHIVDLCYYNWYAFKQREYEILVRVLARLMVVNDEWLSEYINLAIRGEISVRDSFSSDLMYRLWEENHIEISIDNYEYYTHFKTFLVNGVINRCKYWWFVHKDQDAAKREISKLAKDAELFDPNNLCVLLNNVKTQNLENGFLSKLLFRLTELRKDWDFDAALEMAESEMIKYLLTTQRVRESLNEIEYV